MKAIAALLVASLLALTLPACVGAPPTSEEIRAADFGACPTAYEDTIRAHFEQVLKDPESARYEIGRPVKGYYGKTLTNLAGPRDIRYGWLVRTGVNAKNSFGGYTGTQEYHCWFRGEELVAAVSVDDIIWQVSTSTPISGGDEEGQ